MHKGPTMVVPAPSGKVAKLHVHSTLAKKVHRGKKER